ncbi:NAD(P)-binding domain-containing protein, partial [Pseudomonas aeruginosa]|uniref:NAD(P)-binding domain-containing protein n=1 Tax=Pseudomonas aeruginosa TaxID=287 RepID=UPI003896D5B6
MITTDYVSTFSGNRFYPLRPHIDKVAIEDIAHGLAYQCRFNGQTQVFYSIAQHSLIVASLVPPPLRLAALLHDAAEAYLGDMVKPLKVLLPEFAALEDKVNKMEDGLATLCFANGMGAIGAVVQSLLRAGFAVHACDVRPDTVQQLVDKGAHAAQSPAALAAQVQALLIVVVNAQQTETVL